MAKYKKKEYSEEQKEMWKMIKCAENLEKYKETGWPELIGTDMQKGWAGEIKIKFVDVMYGLTDQHLKYSLYGEFVPLMDIFKKEGFENTKTKIIDNFINKCNNCGEIIENRLNGISYVLKFNNELVLNNEF